MGQFTYVGDDARDYFPAQIGHVEPGDHRDLEQAPDVWWEPTDANAAVKPAVAPAPPAGTGDATPAEGDTTPAK